MGKTGNLVYSARTSSRGAWRGRRLDTLYYLVYVFSNNGEKDSTATSGRLNHLFRHVVAIDKGQFPPITIHKVSDRE